MAWRGGARSSATWRVVAWRGVACAASRRSMLGCSRRKEGNEREGEILPLPPLPVSFCLSFSAASLSGLATLGSLCLDCCFCYSVSRFLSLFNSLLGLLSRSTTTTTSVTLRPRSLVSPPSNLFVYRAASTPVSLFLSFSILNFYPTLSSSLAISRAPSHYFSFPPLLSRSPSLSVVLASFLRPESRGVIPLERCQRPGGACASRRGNETPDSGATDGKGKGAPPCSVPRSFAVHPTTVSRAAPPPPSLRLHCPGLHGRPIPFSASQRTALNPKHHDKERDSDHLPLCALSRIICVPVRLSLFLLSPSRLFARSTRVRRPREKRTKIVTQDTR